MGPMVAIMVHGGAGERTDDDDPERCAAGCLVAARAGHRVLAGGGSAVDAVSAAVAILEDDPQFNAGTGACLNADGEVELDASLMMGQSLAAGSVAGVRGVKNPIVLARAVMERTPHVLLVGDGAQQLAQQMGVPTCDPAALITDGARRRWAAHQAVARAAGHGTVGAVARDAQGHVAAATSTGGMVGKRAGRVGDSPLIGCGTYADDRSGAASATGHGEAIIKVVLAKRACDAMKAGLAPEIAALVALNDLGHIDGKGGLILIDRRGKLGFGFNTQRMARAWIDGDGAERSGFAT